MTGSGRSFLNCLVTSLNFMNTGYKATAVPSQGTADASEEKGNPPVPSKERPCILGTGGRLARKAKINNIPTSDQLQGGPTWVHLLDAMTSKPNKHAPAGSRQGRAFIPWKERF